jgi:enamine deaminase RidA (YjgF/YER057c/UK114 family)
MLERFYVTPEGSYKVGGNYQKIYTPVLVVKGADHAHIYISGRVSRDLNGHVTCKGDMRGQIRGACENLKVALESVGATFADITRTITFTTDMKAYFEAIDERFKYFKEPLPTSTLMGISNFAMPDLLLEIESEAIIEPERLRLPNMK